VDGSGRRPESRRPAPSLSSGATAEYDRSRQSTDPLVSPTAGKPFRDRPGKRADGCLHRARSSPARQRRPTPIARIGALEQRPSSRGGDLRRGCTVRTDGQRSRHEPQGSVSDRPEPTPSTEAGSDCYRAPSGRGGKPPPTMPHPAAAGSEEPHPRGATRERARGVELVTDNTQVT
jgi:hypothetical protein